MTTNVTTALEEDALSFAQLTKLVWQRKILVCGLILLGGAIGAGWSILITPEYQARVVVAPTTAESGAGSMLGDIAGQLGGLGSLVSPGLFSGRGREESVEFLRSRYVVERYIEQNNLLPVLFENRWDAKAGKWKYGSRPPPTLGEGYRRFTTRVRTIADDRRTGLVTLVITWRNRAQCESWANGLVALANRELRRRAIEESERNIAYLESELTKTQLVDLQQAIYRIIETQMRTIMLAKGRDEYAFKIIDPAVVPDLSDRVRPKRVAMTLVGLILGGVAGIIWVILAISRGPQTGRTP